MSAADRGLTSGADEPLQEWHDDIGNGFWIIDERPMSDVLEHVHFCAGKSALLLLGVLDRQEGVARAPNYAGRRVQRPKLVYVGAAEGGVGIAS